ncbi:hypothetical protein GCM10022226_26300 [Sphaerisporangium flaviroseum]|uniref:Uncharacterized protein n=1 Tax=Sphaerisporangium flaviroseum TaxID=509199 RepID=A0ABP7HY90_9ACTN
MPRQGGFPGVAISADLGAKVGSHPPFPADHGDPGGHLLGRGIVAAAQATLQRFQVIAGSGEFFGAGSEGGLRARRGVHEDTPQVHHRVALARSGQRHGVLHDVPRSPLISRFAGVPLSDIFHRGGRGHLQPTQHLGCDIGLGRRCDEGDLLAVHRGQIRIRDQLGVADHQQPPAASELLQRLHRADDLPDLARASVERAMEDRDCAITADGDPGLNLLQVRAAVLGMTKLRRRESRRGLNVVAVQGDRGHVPVHAGHIDAEPLDHDQPDRSDQVIEVRGDRVERPADPIIVEQYRIDTERFLNRPVLRPGLHVHQRAGEVNRLAISTSMTCP